MLASVPPFDSSPWPPTFGTLRPHPVHTDPDRVLLTLLFTDIVASTATAEELGDRAWCALLLRHRAVVRRQLETCRGCEINTMGDAFFVAFNRPSRALEFAAAARVDLEAIGVAIRTGIHVGECEVTDGKVEGLAVHTAARIAAAAGRGEILVSGTVRELVCGGDFRFEERDPVTLKGLSEQRRLYALQM